MIPVTHTNMNISLTEFKQRCLEIIRQVEKTGRPVAITRRGKVVVRLTPSWPAGHGGLKPWEQLRALGGRLLAEPGESVLHDRNRSRPGGYRHPACAVSRRGARCDSAHGRQ